MRPRQQRRPCGRRRPRLCWALRLGHAAARGVSQGARRCELPQGPPGARPPRAPLKGRHSPGAVHMPKAHQPEAAWPPHRRMLWAANPGEAPAPVVAAMLASRPHPPQGFRAC